VRVIVCSMSELMHRKMSLVFFAIVWMVRARECRGRVTS